MGKLSPEANEEIIFRHPDNSSSAIRGDVIQPPNIYVKMRIAAFQLATRAKKD
jgi:hypothetical protein